VTFDPAAAFLLDLSWDQLFEPASAAVTNTDYRCKGCREIVKLGRRERHHHQHVRERQAQIKNERAKLKRERLKRLAEARAAR
jgi:hypothetical protein